MLEVNVLNNQEYPIEDKLVVFNENLDEEGSDLTNLQMLVKNKFSDKNHEIKRQEADINFDQEVRRNAEINCQLLKQALQKIEDLNFLAMKQEAKMEKDQEMFLQKIEDLNFLVMKQEAQMEKDQEMFFFFVNKKKIFLGLH